MDPMKTATVTRISDYDDRTRRVGRAVAARRRLDSARSDRRRSERRGGRVWVNGRELGGTDPRHAHLALSFD
jgi:hypothetical protein